MDPRSPDGASPESRLHQELEQRDAKIRRLIGANIIGIFTWRLDGEILEANGAFLGIIGYDREDLTACRLRWTELTPPEWLERRASRPRDQEHGKPCPTTTARVRLFWYVAGCSLRIARVKKYVKRPEES